MAEKKQGLQRILVKGCPKYKNRFINDYVDKPVDNLMDILIISRFRMYCQRFRPLYLRSSGLV